MLVLGLYLAYGAASMVAGDVESGRMNTLLATPISRRKLPLEKFSSLLVPIVLVNAITPIVLYAGSVLIGEPLAIVNLLALHALAIPYLLCYGRSASRAQCFSGARASRETP